MIKIFSKIFSLLNRKEKAEFSFLACVIIFVGVIEVAGIASVMPFMAVISNPDVVEKNPYLHWCYKAFSFETVNEFIIFLGVTLFLLMILSNGMKIIALWLELKFVHYRVYNISRRLLLRYLTQPYTFYLNANTTILGKNLLQEAAQFSHHVLRPFTQIFSKIIIVLFIVGFLVLIDVTLAIVISFLIGGAYLLLYIITSKKLTKLGEDRFQANSQRSKIAFEAFGGIKIIKLLNCEKFFYDNFSVHAKFLELSYAKSDFLSKIPSNVMEILSFGSILVIVLFYILVRQDFEKTLPVIALYAFSGYRLMPALQGLFSALTSLKFNIVVLETLHRDLENATSDFKKFRKNDIISMPFKHEIRLDSATFSYPGKDQPTLKSFSLVIKKNENIGLVGSTGSGKTTTVDIILGLLLPESGCLNIDGEKVNAENLVRWQKNIGYVPQSIFLSDDTITSNIAFGINNKEINMEAVKNAAIIANLHEFVINELPNGYQTIVGENGIRLSGGQKQRIGIARALYHDPDILIMDEATSALDGITEDIVIQAIRKLSGKKTIITIAHRLSTLKDCDIIYVVDKGKIIEQGNYNYLINSSDTFMAMAKMKVANRNRS